MHFDNLEYLLRNNQKKNAKIMEVSQSQISYYSRGLKTMGIDKLYKLCKAYNLSADELLGLSKNEVTNNEQ